MVNKTPRTRPKIMLHIMEGGERTYIHPYSYSEAGSPSQNSLKFLSTPEFKPDQEETETDFLFELQNGKFGNSPGYVARYLWGHIVRRVWRFLKMIWGRRVSPSLYSHLWNSLFPVYCASIYEGPTISVPGTLNPSNKGQKWTETYYLIPSQEWIKSKLKTWLFEPVPSDASNSVLVNRYDSFSGLNLPSWITYHEHARNSYLTWAEKQVKMGRKIGFLTSLDT